MSHPTEKSAKEVPIGNWLRDGQDATGIAIGHGDAPPDAEDKTGTVQVLVYDVGNGGGTVGEVSTLGGMELVIDLGPPALPA